MEIRYYKTLSGRNPVREFVKQLSPRAQNKFEDLIMQLEQGKHLALPDSRSLGNIYRGLRELRIKDEAGIYRIFYYIKVKEAIYILNAFKKTSQHQGKN